MIAYTPFDFFIQSVLIVFIGGVFWLLVLGLFAGLVYAWEVYRDHRRQARRPKIAQIADYQKPGDLEDA